MLLAVSFPLAFSAYAGPYDLFTLFEGSASIAFWIAIAGLVLVFPLRKVSLLFLGYIRRPRGLLIFISYLFVHLFLYGILLEGLIGLSLKTPSFSQFSANFASIPLYPVSIVSILAGFGFNPSLDLFIPPFFVLALSVYTITLSLIIAVLVQTNIMKVLEIGKMCGIALKSRTLVILPALGVIGGAACCLSLPILISLAAPTAAIVANDTAVWYGAYFIFPSATAVGLKYNMDSTIRIASKMSKIIAPTKAAVNAPKSSTDLSA